MEKGSQNFWGKKGSVGLCGKCDRLLAGKKGPARMAGAGVANVCISKNDFSPRIRQRKRWGGLDDGGVLWSA